MFAALQNQPIASGPLGARVVERVPGPPCRAFVAQPQRQVQYGSQWRNRRLQEAAHGGDASAPALYRRASVADKARVRAQCATSDVRAVHALERAFGDPDATGKGVGYEFELLRERELFNDRPDARLGEGISEVRVYERDMWDSRIGDGGEPVAHSLIDERMGPVRSHTASRKPVLCQVCHSPNNVDAHIESNTDGQGMCDGHFGHIVLPGAVWHPFTVRLVIWLLRSVCWFCGRLPLAGDKLDEVRARAMRECSSRMDRLKLLGKLCSPVRTCAPCAAEHRCAECRDGAAEQCEQCASFVYFRPKLRTTMQARGEVERNRDTLIEGDGGGGDDDDGTSGAPEEQAERTAAEERDQAAARHAAAADRSNGRTGFPCDAKLNGNASARQVAAYRRFAEHVYGKTADSYTRVMHGERVRAIIGALHSDTLELLREHAGESAEDVREWLYALVPRVMPVIPNCARPSTMDFNAGSGESPVQLDDLTHRYAVVLHRCADLSKLIDASAPKDEPALFYDRVVRRGGRTQRMPAVSSGLLYEPPTERWFESMPGDKPNVLLVYGELQYYYAAVLSQKDSLRFLPGASSAHGVGRSARARGKRAAADSAGGNNDSTSARAVSHSLREKIEGKEGRIRGNLNGKRVFQSGRSVISSEPAVGIGGVRIPRSMAARLVVRERVNALNVLEQTTRAERIRTGQFDRRECPQRGAQCVGCVHCEELAVDETTELYMYNPERTERVCITRGRGRERTMAQPVAQHAYATQAGAYIERPLRVGDTVVLNRQPSLHAPSMQAFKVEIISDADSMGINTAVCKPFNADFDGDEMNVHVPVSLGAEAELQQLMTVRDCLISSRSGAPHIGLVQDGATGMHLLTRPDTFLSFNDACRLVFAAARGHDDMRLPVPAIRVRNRAGKLVPYWTGLQIANYALPPTDSNAPLHFCQPRSHTLDARTLNYPSDGVKGDTELPMLVRNGEFMYGTFYKRTASSSAGSLQRAIAMRVHIDGGPSVALDQAVTFINRCNWLADSFLAHYGFSIGIADCMPPDGTARQQEAIRETAEALEAEVARMLVEDDELLRTGRFADRVSTIEARIMALEQRAFDEVGRMVRELLPSTNSLVVMKVSGGKGNMLNQTQIMGCLGGNQLGGRRVVDKFLANDAAGLNSDVALASERDGGCETTMQAFQRAAAAGGGTTMPTSRMLNHLLTCRLSPHMPRGTYPGARDGGFVANSFMTGLHPREFFLHAQAGREGLIDTAIKTADVGDQMRLAIKSHEGITKRYDGTTRDAANQIIGHHFGALGADPRCAHRLPLPFLSAPLARTRLYTEWQEQDWRYRRASDAGRSLLRAEQKRVRAALDYLRTLSAECAMGDVVSTPLDIDAIAQSVCADLAHSYDGRHATDASTEWLQREKPTRDADPTHPLFSAEPADLLVPAQCVYLLQDRIERWRKSKPPVLDRVTECAVRLRLCSKQVMRRWRLTLPIFEQVLEVCEQTLYRSRLDPGTAVGVVAAQNVGEPSTQMTLNSKFALGEENLRYSRSPKKP